MSKKTTPHPKQKKNDDKKPAPLATRSTNHVEEPASCATVEEEPIKKLQADLAEAKDKYLRLYAEFENHRRRTAQEKIGIISHANEKLLIALLPILDDFERAESAGNKAPSKSAGGFQLIQNKLRKAIEQFDVKEIALTIGSDFDSNIHEAITKIPAAEEKLKGKVVDIIEKGYTLRDKVIRYPKIVVGE